MASFRPARRVVSHDRNTLLQAPPDRSRRKRRNSVPRATVADRPLFVMLPMISTTAPPAKFSVAFISTPLSFRFCDIRFGFGACDSQRGGLARPLAYWHTRSARQAEATARAR